jgi:hypothetical protein
MNTKLTLLVAGTLSTIVVSGSVTKAAIAHTPLVITDIAGAVRILQDMPCGDPLDLTVRSRRGGWISRPKSSCANARSGRADVRSDAPGYVPRALLSAPQLHAGIRGIAEFSEIGLRLAGAVRFPGEEIGGVGSLMFRFMIPKEDFLILESVLDNAPVPQPEKKYQRPSENVTGLIDLRHKTVQLRVVLTTELRFRAACASGRCLIDQIDEGTQTADILGSVPPSITCTAVRPPGNSFRVFTDEDPTPILRLGSYPLTNGEVFQLQQTGQPGVRLLGTNRFGDIPHFQVGMGENFITATDLAGNVSIAFCR